MKLWKNGKKPPYMNSEEIDLNADKVLYAVKNLSYLGLQAVAVYGLLALGKFKSPAEIMRDLKVLGGTEE